MMLRTLTRVAVFASLLSGVSTLAHAQSATDGAIGGTVEDTAGAVVPNATVVIHSNDTNAEQKVVADSQGSFRVTHLNPGTYTVTISSPGFGVYKASQTLVQVGLVTTLEPHMAIGTAETSIDVSSEIPAINFTSSDFASNLNAQTIDDLPINGRRWSDLALLTPGVVADSNGFGLLSFRGISPLLNNIEIDGADDNQAFFSEERGRTREGYSTSQAAVREFQVNTGVYSAEYGRAAGGVVNSVTKSGSNTLHGTLYFYDRDNDFGAINPYTTNTTAIYANGSSVPTSFVTAPYKPKDWRKEYGFAVGGPLIKDKLFWFYAFDGYKRNFPGTAKPSNPAAFFLLPDQPTTSGGNTVTPSGSSYTYSCNTSTGALTVTNPPPPPATAPAASAIDIQGCVLAARLSLSSYALGVSTYSSDLASLNTDLGPVPRTGTQIINTPKIDWQATPKQHVSVLFHRLRWDSPGGVQTQATNNYAIDSFGTDFVKLDYGLARLDTLITSNLSNEARYQYSRELDDEGSQTQSAYTKAHFLANGNPVQLSIQSSNGFTAGIPYYSFRVAYPDERKWQISDTATWSRGQHSVKFGVDIVHNYDLQNNLFESNGVYTYTYLANLFSDEALPSGTCNSSASNTVVVTTGGNPCYSSFVQGFGTPVFDLNTLDYGFFAQDDWKVSPRLTLNVGLRYDYESLPNQFSNLINPAFPATGNRPSDKNNLGPRIGFAYDPFGIGKTVLRGGYGMYYGRVFNSLIFNTYLNTGLVQGQNTITYKNTTANRPILPNIITASPTALPGTPNLEYFAKNFQNPMVHEYDMTVQQQIGKGTTMSVTYLGAMGRELPNFINLNLTPTYTTTLTFVPASGTSNCGPAACGSQITTPVFSSGAQSTAFGSITQVTSNVNTSYNGLVGEVKNSSSKYVQFDMNYTWSHALDYNQNSSTSPTVNNFFNPYASGRQNYGNSNFNVPNRLVGYAMVFLPSHATGWMAYLLNGWDINPLMQLQNGLPFSANTSGFVSGNSFGGGINGSGVTYIPQLGRNTIQQKRTIDFDVRVEKEVKIAEKYTLQLIGEGFNLANHQNVTSVNTTGYTIGGTASAATLTYNPSFATPTNANSNYVYSPRQIQLAVRLEF